MNNKGFAISTMLYGLSVVGLMLAVLMVQTMSSSRSEQRKLAEAIRDELSDFSVLSEYYHYDDLIVEKADGTIDQDKSGYTSFKTPVSGWYKIELWSASKYFVDMENDSEDDENPVIDENLFNQAEDPANGGSYSSQTLYLKEGTTLNIFLGNISATNASVRETKVCNRKARASCVCPGGTYCMATSTERFTARTRGTFDDEYDEFVKNPLSTMDTNYEPNTIYYGDHLNINDKGKARISLVSTVVGTKYTPLPNSAADKSGTFYIIDAKYGTALGFANIAVDSTGNIIKDKLNESIAFDSFTGEDSQKWKYNPQDHSFVNVRTNYSLRLSGAAEHNPYVMAIDYYMDRNYEKWTMKDVTPTAYTNNVLLKNYANSNVAAKALNISGSYYLYHNRKSYLELPEAYRIYANEEIKLVSSSTLPAANAYRNFMFYIINAY